MSIHIGTEVSLRGISGRITTIVRKGDRWNKTPGNLKQPTNIWVGDDFVVIRDRLGRSHHALLREVA